MDDNRIISTFFGHLENKSPYQAAAETYRRIGEELLAQVYENRTVEKPVWDMLLKMMRNLSALNFYVNSDKTPGEEAFSFGPEHFARLAMLFQAWRDTLAYLAENYESLKSDMFRARFSHDQLRLFVKTLDKRIAGTAEEIMNSGLMYVAQREFHMMASIFRIAIRVTIGEEEYEKFTEKFNKNMVTLKVYYLQTVAPPNRGGSKPS